MTRPNLQTERAARTGRPDWQFQSDQLPGNPKETRPKTGPRAGAAQIGTRAQPLGDAASAQTTIRTR
eukprot:8541459-Pyramimonas_sp.AAC.1